MKIKDCSLIQGDCLKVMKGIPDNSIDMVCCDPPYGITSHIWDTIIPLAPMWTHLKRIIKPNRAIVITATEPFATLLIFSNIKSYRHAWYWQKNQATGVQRCWQEPLRNIDGIYVFINKINYSLPHSLRFKSVLKDKIAQNKIKYKDLDKFCGFSAHHYLNISQSWANVLPSKKKLKIICEFIGWDFKEAAKFLDEIINEGKKYARVYNPLDVKKANLKNYYYGKKEIYTQEYTNFPRQLLEFKIEVGLHPTQKPVALMEYLIKTYTNEGDMVLDFAAGSFTTGVACVNLDRKFIGIELDKGYFKIGVNRIKDAVREKESSLF